MTIETARLLVADRVVDVMAVLPGMTYDTIMNFSFAELMFWFERTKRLRRRN